MSLADLVRVDISVASANPTKPGFGRALIAAANLPSGFQGTTQLYADLEEMTAAGFAVTHPAYLAASALVAQKPRVADWKIGRRNTATVQDVRLLCATPSHVGEVYSFDLNGVNIRYVSLISDTSVTVATALDALVTDATVLAVVSGSELALGRVAGGLNDVANWTSNLRVRDNSADPGLATDLAAIKAADNDWFGLVLDSNSKAETLAAAAWAEANGKIFSGNTSDYAATDGASTTDVAYALKSFAYANTHLLFSGKKLLSYSGAAMLGAVFTDAPGSTTWKFKTLRGVPMDDRFSLTTGASAAARAKNCNVYSDISGIGTTEEGKSSSGEFIDVTHFVFWLKAEIQVRVLALFARTKKVPYTDQGIEQIKNEVRGTLADGFAVGGLADAPLPGDVTAPTALSANPLDRAARKLRPVKFSGRLAGAIHNLEVVGTLTV